MHQLNPCPGKKGVYNMHFSDSIIGLSFAKQVMRRETAESKNNFETLAWQQQDATL